MRLYLNKLWLHTNFNSFSSHYFLNLRLDRALIAQRESRMSADFPAINVRYRQQQRRDVIRRVTNRQRWRLLGLQVFLNV